MGISSTIAQIHYRSLDCIDELLLQHHKSFTEVQVVKDKIFWVFFDDCSENGENFVRPYNGSCRSDGKVFIHRAEINRPNASHIHELSYVLHEVGHSLLLDKKTKLSKTGYSYKMLWEEQPSYTRLEELSAWIMGMKTACKLPVPWWYLIMLLIIMYNDAVYFWVGYVYNSLDY